MGIGDGRDDNECVMVSTALPGGKGGTKDLTPDWLGWDGRERPLDDHLPVSGCK